MYTEKSIELKSDFYTRYGQAAGTLYFERTGIPCALMEGTSSILAFSMQCGVRAYGRQYGDIIKIMNSERNVFDIHFVENGCGAQILYKQDLKNIKRMDEVTEYTIDKLLVRMGLKNKFDLKRNLTSICDSLGKNGWCAYCDNGKMQQLPLPMYDYHVLIIRTQKNGRFRTDRVLRMQFAEEEARRIKAAAAGLKKCRTEVLFEMMNESERSIERLLMPSRQAVIAVEAARCADGVLAAKICDAGIVCFVEKDKIDSVIHRINMDFEKNIGYSAGIIAAI